MDRIIIGFGHKRQRGKGIAGTYALRYLRQMGLIGERVAFADALKNAIRAIFGLSWKQLEYEPFKSQSDIFWGLTPRDILQRLGTDAVRNNFGEDVWVRALQRKMDAAPTKSFVICDVRFPNEAEKVQELGGLVVRLDRDCPPDERDEHITETALDDWDKWDYIVENNFDLGLLEEQVRDIVEKEVDKRGLLEPI